MRDLTHYWILRHLIGLWSNNGFSAVCLYDITLGFSHCLFWTFWSHRKARDPNFRALATQVWVATHSLKTSAVAAMQSRLCFLKFSQFEKLFHHELINQSGIDYIISRINRTNFMLIMFVHSFCNFGPVVAETLIFPGLSDFWTPVLIFYHRNLTRFIP